MLAIVALGALALARPVQAQSAFEVLPYLQNPGPDAMTILWFSQTSDPGRVTWGEPGAAAKEAVPETRLASALAYLPWEAETFFDGKAPDPPYRHRVRLTGLRQGTAYAYRVVQGAETFVDTFVTAPAPDHSPIRMIFFGDDETEPESTGFLTPWEDPTGADPDRQYLLDQTTGFANNLAVILERRPDLVGVAGDVVAYGGEQRDWNEFWRQVTHVGPGEGADLAGAVPILGVLGNHDYYNGSHMGGYDQPYSEIAVRRFRSYFEAPANGAPHPEQEGRYYRTDYGPVTLIALDVTNGTPNGSEDDTNFYLRGEGDPGGGFSPGFGPGTRQYEWLREQLQDAQKRSPFTFVIFHHCPYSVGPHGWSPGDSGDGFDLQSGVPVQALTPLFLQYGVDAVIAGHDEMYEHSVVDGEEVLPDGARQPRNLHFYDVGTGGDELRGPEPGLSNPQQRFLAHTDAPEVWQDGVLVSGGKHYGHLEVNVLRTREGSWQAVLEPAYVFPLFGDGGDTYLGYERRVYDDIVTLTRSTTTAVTRGDDSRPRVFGLEVPYPNPFNHSVLLRYSLPAAGPTKLTVYDARGRSVCELVNGHRQSGYHSLEWAGVDKAGKPVGTGVYFVSLSAGALRDTTRVTLVK